jgi:integrase
MVAGRQHRESSHSSNKRIAKNLLAIRQAQVLEGRLQLPRSKPPRFEDWAEQLVLSIRHPNTKRRYACSVEKLKLLFKGFRLSQIDPGSIERFKEKRLSLGIRSATVNRDLAVLRRMLKLAERQRLIAHSPFNEVEFLEERKERRQPHILTYGEEKKLMAVAGPMLAALTILLVESCGPDIEQACVLTKFLALRLKSTSTRLSALFGWAFFETACRDSLPCVESSASPSYLFPSSVVTVICTLIVRRRRPCVA